MAGYCHLQALGRAHNRGPTNQRLNLSNWRTQTWVSGHEILSTIAPKYYKRYYLQLLPHSWLPLEPDILGFLQFCTICVVICSIQTYTYPTENDAIWIIHLHRVGSAELIKSWSKIRAAYCSEFECLLRFHRSIDCPAPIYFCYYCIDTPKSASLMWPDSWIKTFSCIMQIRESHNDQYVVSI